MPKQLKSELEKAFLRGYIVIIQGKIQGIHIYIYIYMLPPPLKPTVYQKNHGLRARKPLPSSLSWDNIHFHNKYVTNTRDIPLL